MAAGDLLSQSKKKIAREGIGYSLLAAANAVGNGPWCDIRNLQPGSIHVSGTFVGTVKIEVSNSDADPGSGVSGIQVGSDITAAAMALLTARYRFIRACVTAYTSGAINANFHSTT